MINKISNIWYSSREYLTNLKFKRNLHTAGFYNYFYWFRLLKFQPQITAQTQRKKQTKNSRNKIISVKELIEILFLFFFHRLCCTVDGNEK